MKFDVLGTDHLILGGGRGGGLEFFTDAKFFLLNSLVQICFPFFCTAEFFLLRRRGWDIFVWRNVSVREDVLGAARYCAEGTMAHSHQGATNLKMHVRHLVMPLT